MVNVKCSAIQVNSFFPARLVWGVREREREYKISWPCQKSKAKLKNSGAPFFLFSPGVCLYMKNKLQLFQVNPWQRLAAGDMFTVSDAFTARGLGNGLLVQKLLRETSVEFGVEWLIWQNKYLLRAKGMRQVTMKTLDTDALFRSLVVEESAICKPLLWALPVQPQEPNGLGWFFSGGGWHALNIWTAPRNPKGPDHRQSFLFSAHFPDSFSGLFVSKSGTEQIWRARDICITRGMKIEP